MALTTNQAEWQLKAACRGPQAAVFFPPTTPERRDEKRFRETIAKDRRRVASATNASTTR